MNMLPAASIKRTAGALSLAAVSFLALPASRADEADLLPTIRPIVSQLSTESSLIPEDRQAELRKIALYIRSKNAAGEPAQLTFICTHNSRRSHMAALWAETAARYYDVPNVKVFSGGIEVTACNIRTVRAFRRAGFSAVDSTGGTNPVYLVQFSDTAPPMRAFSKLYDHDGNPTSNYLAAMTCAHADKNCPIVEGSSMRVGIHYEDPKDFDGKPDEEKVYDERLRQIGREMFFIFAQVKR